MHLCRKPFERAYTALLSCICHSARTYRTMPDSANGNNNVGPSMPSQHTHCSSARQLLPNVCIVASTNPYPSTVRLIAKLLSCTPSHHHLPYLAPFPPRHYSPGTSPHFVLCQRPVVTQPIQRLTVAA